MKTKGVKITGELATSEICGRYNLALTNFGGSLNHTLNRTQQRRTVKESSNNVKRKYYLKSNARSNDKKK